MQSLVAVAVASACVLVSWAGAATRHASAATNPQIVFGVSHEDKSGIYVIKSDATGLRKLTDGRDGGPVWSPEASRIAFTRTRVIGEDFRGDDVTTLDLHVMNANGSGLRRLVPIAHQPDWSPDGRKLAFVRYFGEAVTIWTANADGTGLRRLVRGESPDWSPDGRRIAFERWTGDLSEVFVMSANGNGERRLVRGGRLEGWAPAWSPNGRKISFFGAWEDHVYTADADGGALMRIAPFIGETGDPPAWAPDGRNVAFARYLDTNNSPNNNFIYVARPTGAGPPRRLAGPDTWNPQWSRDGRRILFVKGHDTINVMNANGTGARRVVRIDGVVGGMDW